MLRSLNLLGVVHSRVISNSRMLSIGLDWMKQAELEARAASKGKTSVVAGESPSMHLMNKIEHEMMEERVQHASNLTDKLENLIKKCHENSGNRIVYAALRNRTIATRQELIIQREVSGMAIDQQVNAALVESQFPIPPMQ
jgi:dihydrodipicolinate synthase/N-acetylneuraminate lyase